MYLYPRSLWRRYGALFAEWEGWAPPRTLQPSLRSFLPLMRYHSISRTLFPVSSLSPYLVPARLLYKSRVFFFACSCSRTFRASLYVATRVRLNYLLCVYVAQTRKISGLHAWRATKEATRKSLVVIRTRALARGISTSRAYRVPRLNHYWEERGQNKSLNKVPFIKTWSFFDKNRAKRLSLKMNERILQ